MPVNTGRHGVGAVLLSLVLALSLLLPAMLAPQIIKAEDADTYALVQIPSPEKEATLKAAVEGVLDSAGTYAIVGCTQTQLDSLVADGYIVIDQCTAGEECLAQLADELKAAAASEITPQKLMKAFGYRFIDSNEDDGPCFNWIDITGTGTNTGINCDDCGVVVPIGFPFKFYGDSHSEVGISSNGYLTFGANLDDFTNDCIPNIADPNDSMFVFWDDLYIDCAGANVYYETRNIRGVEAFIVEWKDARFCCYCYAYRLNFEAILFQGSNDIMFQYLSMTGGNRADGREATVGIENNNGLDGLEYSCDSPVISDSLAILFYVPPLKSNYPCPTEQSPAEPRVSPQTPRVLNPAQVSLQYLSVTPQQTAANQPVTITTNVVNTGDEAGSYNVVLKINGLVEQTKMVAVGPQATQPVKFTVARSQPGTYSVDIAGKTGSFIIAGGSTAGKPINSGLIAIIVMSFLVLSTVVGLAIAFRRSA